jgi:hypothetical protein
MKFKSVLKKLIVENTKFNFLYDRWVIPSVKAIEKNPKAKGIIDFDTFKKIVFADPTTKGPQNFDIDGASVDDMKLVKVGGNSDWLLKNFVKPPMTEELKDIDPKSKEFKNAIKSYRELFMEDLYKKTDQLNHFELVKQYLPQNKRDINKLSQDELLDIFENVKVPEKKLKTLEKNVAKKTREGFKHAGGQIIHEGSDWIVIKMKLLGMLPYIMVDTMIFRMENQIGVHQLQVEVCLKVILIVVLFMLSFHKMMVVKLVKELVYLLRDINFIFKVVTLWTGEINQ